MRRDAIYPSIVVGKPPAEDAWLGKATERIFLPAIRATVPEIVDYDLPVAGAFHNCAIVSIRKAYPGQARKVMHAIWGLGLLSLTKSVDRRRRARRRARLRAGLLLRRAPTSTRRATSCSPTGPADHLDHATDAASSSAASSASTRPRKLPDEGAREWPPEIEMSAEVARARRSALGRVRDRDRSRRSNGALRHSSARLLESRSRRDDRAESELIL